MMANDRAKRDLMHEWIVDQQQRHTKTIDDVDIDDDDEEELDDIESIVESTDYESDNTEPESDVLTTELLGTQKDTDDMSCITESLRDIFNSINSIQTVGNVNINNSTGVHIGNVTNINGNIQFIQHVKRSPKDNSKQHKNSKDRQYKECNSDKEKSNSDPVEHKGRVYREAFLNNIKIKIPKTLCSIIPRSTWLAQAPMEEYEYLKSPAEYVIIGHTATESSIKQAINIRIIRDIQCFHIESREWNDIAYNFLIGCDGNCYEGRGWGVIGAHTKGYNICSIGITFIGCFMRVLPNDAAMNAYKNLIKRGLSEGYIAPNYKLVCHCQCRPTESPGRTFFEEIKTWENFHSFDNAPEGEEEQS